MISAVGVGAGIKRRLFYDSKYASFIIGPKGQTICSSCKYSRQHIHGTASKLRKCPKCGSYMVYKPEKAIYAYPST